MKPRNSLNISLLAAATLSGCSQPPHATQLQQCQQIVSTYTPLLAYHDTLFTTSETELTIKLDFTVNSAFGPQPGNASCRYPVMPSSAETAGEFSNRPNQIVIGDTRHSGEQDITDLINGKYADGQGLPSHQH